MKLVLGLEELEKFCGFAKFVTEAMQVSLKISEFLTKKSLEFNFSVET